MYHRVWHGMNDGLTITPDKLQEQWKYLQHNGYTAISLPDFLHIAKNGKPPEKYFLLTFDDGYVNNLHYVYPLLQEYNWKATYFIIADNIDGSSKEKTDEMGRKMNLSQLKQLDPSIVQLGMHGYHHENFKESSLAEIKTAIENSIRTFENSGLSYFKVLAYPYGARPTNAKIFKELKQWMVEIGIEAAFRIGNQVSRIPAPDIFEIKRIDIKGTDSIEDFKIKLKKGKLKPF
jgi:peptidoglycan/xylan/chitin deacetylase (PgdA/CDA1 family)